MAVIVGSARSDENGKDHGGQAGDQTGYEVETQNWYLHSYGWRVLRCKDAVKANKIAWDMQAACDNPNIGYDKWQDQTLYNVVKDLGFDCSRVTTPCETDCAKLVRVCVLYAGIQCDDFYTGNEATVLLQTGQFEELKDAKYTKSSEYLKRGDILVTTKQGHTVVVLTNGSKADGDDEIAPIYVTTGNVYMRTGASMKWPAMQVVKKGSYVNAIAAVDGWLQCEYKGEIGYCSLKYLQAVEAKEMTTTGNVWLRKSAGILGAQICVIPKGKKVLATGETKKVLTSTWHEVKYDGQMGWCSGKYLK